MSGCYTLNKWPGDARYHFYAQYSGLTDAEAIEQYKERNDIVTHTSDGHIWWMGTDLTEEEDTDT